VKLEGKPTCTYGSEGDDAANENIGMEGMHSKLPMHDKPDLGRLPSNA
jgi:hypothetical protein